MLNKGGKGVKAISKMGGGVGPKENRLRKSCGSRETYGEGFSGILSMDVKNSRM